jgi:hypothetical protein
MPRPRNRVCLQGGLQLNINRLCRKGWLVPGALTGPSRITWSNSYTEELICAALISADMRNERYGWMRIQTGQPEQEITLRRDDRHFGGGQWYFVCPRSWQTCSTLWRPPGATFFASRRYWGRRVAYSSQFEDSYGRALSGARRLRTKLGGPDWANATDDPPKPKGMRWRTYNRLLNRIDAYERVSDERFLWAAARLIGWV